MFAAKVFSEILDYILRLAIALIGWFIITPIISIIPRDKRKIAVIGKDCGKFLDNTKYFYLQAQKLIDDSIQCTFITEYKDIFLSLKEKGLPVLYYPSLKAMIYCCRANIVVVDSFEWTKHFRLFLTFGSKRIQLWHGVGFKRIELDKLKNEAKNKHFISTKALAKFRLVLRNIVGRNVKYHLVNTTSRFYLENVFEKAFSSVDFSIFGYPRNAFNDDKLNLINTDSELLNEVPLWLSQNKKIILLAPTFRESRKTPMNLNLQILNRIDDFCSKNNAVFIFKFHPWERATDKIVGRNIFKYKCEKDIYPIFPYLSAMITDYSSIYMDFLFFNKPIYFLIPDFQEYIENDRDIQFDFNSMTPGYKVKSWDQLIDALQKVDIFQGDRITLCLKAFDGANQEEGTKKLLKFFRQKKWLT